MNSCEQIVSSVIFKRVRNLKKKMSHIVSIEDKQRKGGEINHEQAEALNTKAGIAASLEELSKVQAQIIQTLSTTQSSNNKKQDAQDADCQTESILNPATEGVVESKVDKEPQDKGGKTTKDASIQTEADTTSTEISQTYLKQKLDQVMKLGYLSKVLDNNAEKSSCIKQAPKTKEGTYINLKDVEVLIKAGQLIFVQGNSELAHKEAICQSLELALEYIQLDGKSLQKIAGHNGNYINQIVSAIMSSKYSSLTPNNKIIVQGAEEASIKHIKPVVNGVQLQGDNVMTAPKCEGVSTQTFDLPNVPISKGQDTKPIQEDSNVQKVLQPKDSPQIESNQQVDMKISKQQQDDQKKINDGQEMLAQIQQYQRQFEEKQLQQKGSYINGSGVQVTEVPVVNLLTQQQSQQQQQHFLQLQQYYQSQNPNISNNQPVSPSKYSYQQEHGDSPQKHYPAVQFYGGYAYPQVNGGMMQINPLMYPQYQNQFIQLVQSPTKLTSPMVSNTISSQQSNNLQTSQYPNIGSQQYYQQNNKIQEPTVQSSPKQIATNQQQNSNNKQQYQKKQLSANAKNFKQENPEQNITSVVKEKQVEPMHINQSQNNSNRVNNNNNQGNVPNNNNIKIQDNNYHKKQGNLQSSPNPQNKQYGMEEPFHGFEQGCSKEMRKSEENQSMSDMMSYDPKAYGKKDIYLNRPLQVVQVEHSSSELQTKQQGAKQHQGVEQQKDITGFNNKQSLSTQFSQQDNNMDKHAKQDNTQNSIGEKYLNAPTQNKNLENQQQMQAISPSKGKAKKISVENNYNYNNGNNNIQSSPRKGRNQSNAYNGYNGYNQYNNYGSGYHNGYNGTYGSYNDYGYYGSPKFNSGYRNIQKGRGASYQNGYQDQYQPIQYNGTGGRKFDKGKGF